jgi:hypothetical protein
LGLTVGVVWNDVLQLCKRPLYSRCTFEIVDQQTLQLRPPKWFIWLCEIVSSSAADSAAVEVSIWFVAHILWRILPLANRRLASTWLYASQSSELCMHVKITVQRQL